MESQLQKKEVALLAANNKIELLTSDLQNKVGSATLYQHVPIILAVYMHCICICAVACSVHC